MKLLVVMQFLIVSIWQYSLIASPECLYDHTHDFAYNCGREYPSTCCQRELSENGHEITLFGYRVASPIGIPACAIMAGNGIRWASRAGFDILTYKTVRSRPYSGHPFPNLIVLEERHETYVGNAHPMIAMAAEDSFQADQITMANSMGAPSISLEWALEDIAKAREALLPGQLLIVSIIGESSEERTVEEDFAFLAQAVVGAGAQVVEVNLSNPNLRSPLLTYKDPEAVAAIARAIRESVPNTPLVLKVGLFDSNAQMRDVFKVAARHAQGICGINAIPMQIMAQDETFAFGATRPVAGVSGEFIRSKAYDFIVQAHQIIREEHLDLKLLATGGVMKPEHFNLFLDAGADAVLSATGAMWNPNLAIEFHQQAMCKPLKSP